MRAPDFWHIRYGRDAAPFLRMLLTPLAWLQAMMTARRLAVTVPVNVGVPVVSIGNISLGGTGKTPLARLMRSRLSDVLGGPVAVVSRGHGGRLSGPIAVDPSIHTAGDVGDEPLMLAHDGPVVIGRDRATAALLAARQGMMGLVLDDAHQNPSVARKLNVCVIDAGAGFGNGHLFPAGPLREKPEVGLGRADVVILMGNETPDDEVAEALRAWAGPVFTASLTPAATSNDLSGAGPFLAFCGIGRPAKFEQTLKDCGAHLLDLVPFDDHHPYSASDLARLEQMAADESAQLITTEKDYARLPVSFQTKVKVLKIQALIDDAAGFDALLKSAIERPS